MEHDPLCPVMWGEDGFWSCLCGVIAKVRADERERIAQAIEAWDHPVYANNYPSIYVEDAARIARNGGSDD